MVAYDWESVRAIYLEGLATGDATFETDAPAWDTWDESHLSFPRLVCVSTVDDGVVGWAGLPCPRFQIEKSTEESQRSASM